MAGRFVLLAFFLLTALAACDTNEPDPPPTTLTGQWSGQATLSGAAVTFDLNLVEEATVVSGTGIMASGQITTTFTVEGSYTHPLVNLQFIFQDRPPINLTGMVTDDREEVQGTLSGSGFGGEEIVLARQ